MVTILPNYVRRGGGRFYHNASTMICVPTSLDHQVGEAPMRKRGEVKIIEVLNWGGGMEGPLDMIVEVRA